MTVTEAEPEESADVGRQDVDSEERTVLQKDEIFHLLQNERRRKVLRYLDDTDETVRMRDLAEQVAAWEHDTTVEALMSDERQRVYIALYQAHLPKLDEKGVIEYNQSRGYVKRLPAADQLTPYVGSYDAGSDDDGDGDEDWSQYYLATAGVSAILLVASTAFSLLPGTSVGLIIFAMFSVVTGANLYDEEVL